MAKIFRTFIVIFICLDFSYLIAQINYPATPINPTPEHSGGEYFVFQNTTTTNSIPLSSIRKPIVLIEGYDPLNDNNISNMYNAV